MLQHLLQLKNGRHAMELELGFSFFEDEEEEAELCACSSKEGNHQREEEAKYVVKKEGHLWFDREETAERDKLSNGQPTQCADDQEALLSRIKAKADWSFYKKDYRTALQLYESSLQHVPPHNRSVWRQITDSISRCHYHMGDFPTALKYAVNLVVPPHCEDASSWQLLASIHEKMLNVNDALVCQQRVVIVQSGRPSAWMQLGHACARYSSVLAGSSSRGDPPLDQPTMKDVTSSMEELLARFFLKVLRNLDSLSSVESVCSESRHVWLIDATCACSLLWARHLLTSISIQASRKWKQEAGRQLEELQGAIDSFPRKEVLRNVQKHVSFFTNHLPPNDIVQ